MVEARHDQPDRGLEDDRERPDHQARHRLLHHDEIEIAVEQVAAILIGEEGVLRVDGAFGDFGDDAREEPPFEQRHDPEAHRAEPGHEQQQHEQQPGQRP